MMGSQDRLRFDYEVRQAQQALAAEQGALRWLRGKKRSTENHRHKIMGVPGLMMAERRTREEITELRYAITLAEANVAEAKADLAKAEARRDRFVAHRDAISMNHVLDWLSSARTAVREAEARS